MTRNVRDSKLLAVLATAVLLMVAAGCTNQGTGGSDKEVTVVGSWGGSEQDSFLAMVKPWEDGTGAKVNYTGSRDLAAQLTTGIAGGNLPDVAGLPGP